MLILCALSACGKGGVKLDSDKWLCTKIGEYKEDGMIIAGGAGIPTTEKKTGCIQWTRAMP